MPVVWVNDNFGKWSLTREDLVGRMEDAGMPFLDERRPLEGAPLEMMERNLHAELVDAADVRF